MKTKIVLLFAATCLQVCTLRGADKNVAAIAKQHPIELNKPAVDFFEGAVLGNGGMGVVVTTRPDAVQLHFGHNNVWDIRIAEDNQDKAGTFDEIMAKVKALPEGLKNIRDDKWFDDYFELMRANYDKPYPRPFPCGTVVLGFDRGQTELLGHKLDVSNGLCEVYLLNKNERVTLRIFVDMSVDKVWLSLTNTQGQPVASCFNRMRIMPDSQTPREFPKYIVMNTSGNASHMGFTQILPYQEPDK